MEEEKAKGTGGAISLQVDIAESNAHAARFAKTRTNSIAKGKHDELVSRSRFAVASRFRTHNVASERSRVTELFRESYH